MRVLGLVLPVGLLMASAAHADKLPLKSGEYSNVACTARPDIMTTIGIYVLSDGPRKGTQSLSPQGEGQDGYCSVGRLKVSGKVHSGSAKCESGTRMALPTGTYTFSYTIVDDSTFTSRGKTYRWCAAHR